MLNNYQFAPLEAMPARALRSRGHCCKNACAHCPYGFTLKKFGLHFHDIDTKNLDVANKICNSQMKLKDYPLQDYKIVTLKEFFCAVIRVDKLFVRELFLLEDFADQGITKEVIESYYFY